MDKRPLSPVEVENLELKIRINSLEEDVRRLTLERDALLRRRAPVVELDPNASDAFRRPFRG